MPPEALQEHFSMSPDITGQFPDGLSAAQQEVNDVFASMVGQDFGAQAATEVRENPTAVEIGRGAQEVLIVGGHLRQIRQVVGGFDTPGTHELPVGLSKAFEEAA